MSSVTIIVFAHSVGLMCLGLCIMRWGLRVAGWKKPDILRAWRYGVDHYHVCFRCSSSFKLTTIALEREGYVLGFVFVCGHCLIKTGRGLQLKWHIERPPEEKP